MRCVRRTLAGFAKLAYSRPDPHHLPLETHTEREAGLRACLGCFSPSLPSQDYNIFTLGLNRMEVEKTSRRGREVL